MRSSTRPGAANRSLHRAGRVDVAARDAVSRNPGTTYSSHPAFLPSPTIRIITASHPLRSMSNETMPDAESVALFAIFLPVERLGFPISMDGVRGFLIPDRADGVGPARTGCGSSPRSGEAAGRAIRGRCDRHGLRSGFRRTPGDKGRFHSWTLAQIFKSHRFRAGFPIGGRRD